MGMDEWGGCQGMERQHGTARGAVAASAMRGVVGATSGMETPRMSISVRSAPIGSGGDLHIIVVKPAIMADCGGFKYALKTPITVRAQDST